MTAIDILISAAILAALLGLVALLFLAPSWGRHGSTTHDVRHPGSAERSAVDAVHPTDANSAAQIADAKAKSAGAKGKP